MGEDSLLRLKKSAQRFTAYRERSPFEVVKKLVEWEATPTEIDQIVSELKKEKFLDEVRFARAFSHDKFLINKWGKRRISMELKKHQLAQEIIEKGLLNIDPEEYSKILRQLTEDKWNKLKDKNLFIKRQKTTNYLLQKGFEPDLIIEVLHHIV